MVADHVGNHVAHVGEDVEAILDRHQEISAALANALHTFTQGVAGWQHDHEVALLHVAGDLVPVRFAVIVFAAGGRTVQREHDANAGHASHGGLHLRLPEHVQQLRGALHRCVEEQVHVVERAAPLTLAVEVGRAVLGQQACLDWCLAALASCDVQSKARGVLRCRAQELERASHSRCRDIRSQLVGLDRVHARSLQGLGHQRHLVPQVVLRDLCDRLGVRAGQHQLRAQVGVDVLERLHVEAAGDAACCAELLEHLVHRWVAKQLVAGTSDAGLLARRRHHGLGVCGQVTGQAFGAEVRQGCSRAGPQRVAWNVDRCEHWVVAREHATHPVVPPAGDGQCGSLQAADFILPSLAQCACQVLVGELDVDLLATNLDADRVFTILDHVGVLHNATLLVERWLAALNVHAPQIWVWVGQHEVEQHFAHVVLLDACNGALVIADRVLDQVTCTALAAESSQRLTAEHVDATANAGADGAGLFVHVLEAAQRDVVLVCVFELVELVWRDQAFGQHHLTRGRCDGHQVFVHLVVLILLATGCNVGQDLVGVRVGHAGAAIGEPLVDRCDVGVALFGVLRVGVQRQLVEVDVVLGSLLRQRCNDVVLELVHRSLHAAGHQGVGVIEVLSFTDHTALRLDRFDHALHAQAVVLQHAACAIDCVHLRHCEVLPNDRWLLAAEHRQASLDGLAHLVGDVEAGLRGFLFCIQAIHFSSSLLVCVEASHEAVVAVDHNEAVAVGVVIEAVACAGDVDAAKLLATKLLEQCAHSVGHNLVVERDHAFAADLEVQAGYFAPANAGATRRARSLWRRAQQAAGHFLADDVLQLSVLDRLTCHQISIEIVGVQDAVALF